ncbi:MAG: response regulator, partial [Myxococcales bacterium]|nr:response regulator [Myxococcales bacterium]
ILLDVMMPEMTGVQAFKELAAREETKHIPVIFMTAKVQSHERERYVGFGAAGVIAKPFDPMRLPQEIQGIFAQPAEQRGRNRMAALRQRYAEGLGAKLEGLRASLDLVRAAADHGSAVDAAHRIAHTLHGTAGTYGHQEVSEAMARIERALEELGSLGPTGEAGARDACWTEIEAAFEAASRVSR